MRRGCGRARWRLWPESGCPLMPVEHHYVVTEPIPEIAAMDRELPLIGDADAEFYMRQEGQGLLLGVNVSAAGPTGRLKETPHDFGHENCMPDDLVRHRARHGVRRLQSVPVLPPGGEQPGWTELPAHRFSQRSSTSGSTWHACPGCATTGARAPR